MGFFFVDVFVYEGLGEGRLVSFVVIVFVVVDEIDDNIVLEFSVLISGKLVDVVDSFDIIGIDVEDRGVDSFGDICVVCG